MLCVFAYLIPDRPEQSQGFLVPAFCFGGCGETTDLLGQVAPGVQPQLQSGLGHGSFGG